MNTIAGDNLKKLLYILNSLIVISVFSCGQNSAEKNLNGRWYGIDNDGYTIIHFYTDSLVFTEAYKESVEWNATKSKIKFSLPNNMFYTDSSKNVTVYYKLSKDKDTLFGTIENAFGKNKLNLIRANDYIEYLNKRYEVKFSLPKNDSVKYLNPLHNHSLHSIYGLKVFIGYSNGKVIGKTELSESLNNLKSDIKTFKDSIKPYEHPRNNTQEISNDEHKSFIDRRFHFRVFADKNISDSAITKYLSVNIKADASSAKRHYEIFNRNPPDSIPIKIYRIYNNGQMEFNAGIAGEKIKTIANTIYNK